MRNLILAFAVLLFLPLSVNAQEADLGDLSKRLELATQMHEIRPVDILLENTLENTSSLLPEDRREAFKTEMLKAIDTQQLTTTSVQAMAEVFSVAELQAMVDYFGSEEGRSVSQKMPIYNSLVAPEISKMIDNALLELKVGKQAP